MPAAHREARPDRHDRHRGCDVLPETDRLKGCGEGRRPHPDGQEEPEGAAGGDQASLRRAGVTLVEWSESPQAGHGRVDRRRIAVPAAEALGEDTRREWPAVGCIVRVTREREPVGDGRIARRWRKKGKTAWLTGSLPPNDPKLVLSLNRDRWRIEIMHRDRDVALGEDRYTNRLDHAPRNIFTLLGSTRTLLKRIATSPTRSVEMIQDDRDGALRFLNGGNLGFH